jgi:ribosomal protein S18 acetylase RimI-like enzyme
MTEEEYAAWYPEAIAGYADGHIKAGSMPADSAHEMAAKQFADLLPDGLATPAHHLLIGEADGERVGVLWLNIPTEGERVNAFVYDVEVEESQRGKGYGRGMMVGAERYALDHGAATIKLHVFGDNTVARGLYRSLGYVETNVNMAKPL